MTEFEYGIRREREEVPWRTGMTFEQAKSWLETYHLDAGKPGSFWMIKRPVDNWQDVVCESHGQPLIYEPGGADQPTIHGRTYCPACQDAFVKALDGVDS